MQYRIKEIDFGCGRKQYWVEKYARLWYAPWKKGWVDAITWEDCVTVPYFTDLEEAKKCVEYLSAPIKERIVE